MIKKVIEGSGILVPVGLGCIIGAILIAPIWAKALVIGVIALIASHGR